MNRAKLFVWCSMRHFDHNIHRKNDQTWVILLRSVRISLLSKSPDYRPCPWTSDLLIAVAAVGDVPLLHSLLQELNCPLREGDLNRPSLLNQAAKSGAFPTLQYV